MRDTSEVYHELCNGTGAVEQTATVCMIRLHAGLPGGDSVQTGPTSCHSMVSTFKDADTTISAQRCCGTLRDLPTVMKRKCPTMLTRGVFVLYNARPRVGHTGKTGSVACAVSCWTDRLLYHLDMFPCDFMCLDEVVKVMVVQGFQDSQRNFLQ
jgi:hypothetical protein